MSLEQFTVGIIGLDDNEARGLGWSTAKLLANSGIRKVDTRFVKDDYFLPYKIYK